MKVINGLLLYLFLSFWHSASAIGLVEPVVNLSTGASAPTTDIDITLTFIDVNDATNVIVSTLTMPSGSTVTDPPSNFLFIDEGDYKVFVNCDDECPNSAQSGYYSDIDDLTPHESLATVLTVGTWPPTTNLQITLPLQVTVSGTVIRPAGFATNFDIEVDVSLRGQSGTNVIDVVTVNIPAGANSAPYELHAFPSNPYVLRYDCISASPQSCDGIARYGFRLSNTPTPESTQNFSHTDVPLPVGTTDITGADFILIEGDYIEGTIQYASSSSFTGNFSGEIELCRTNSTRCYYYTVDNQNISSGYTYKIYLSGSSYQYNLRYTCTSCQSDMIESAYVSTNNPDGMSIYRSVADAISVTPLDLSNGFKIVPDINVLEGNRIEGTLLNSVERNGKLFVGTLSLISQQQQYAITDFVPYQNPLTGYQFSFLVPNDGSTWKLKYNYSITCSQPGGCLDSDVARNAYYGSSYTVAKPDDAAVLPSSGASGLNFYVVNGREIGLGGQSNIATILLLLLDD